MQLCSRVAPQFHKARRKVRKTYTKTTTAGSVMAAPSRNTAPGNTSIVAVYTWVYSGTYANGIRFSVRPMIEFTFPVKDKENMFYGQTYVIRKCLGYKINDLYRIIEDYSNSIKIVCLSTMRRCL